MGEFCLHMRAPRGACSVWVCSTERRTPKGIRHRVHAAYLRTGPDAPEGATAKVASVSFEAPWVVFGDLTFVHVKADQTARSPYCRAMDAIRKGHNLGGIYPSAEGLQGIALRLGIKEARIPVEVRVENGRLTELKFDVSDKWVLDCDEAEDAESEQDN